MITNEQAFLQDIRQHPDDDAPRLIYADWLEEHNQPERAEFIRVQCALARNVKDQHLSDEQCQSLQKREKELLPQQHKEWGTLLENLGVLHAELHRGFPAEAHMYFHGFCKEADRIFTLAPIQALTLTLSPMDEAVEAVQQLVALPHLRRLTSLNLRRLYNSAEAIQILAESPYLEHLAMLNLRENYFGNVGVQALATSPYLQHLVTLDIGANSITDVGVRALADSTFLRSLVSLNLSHNRIGVAGAEALAQSSNMQGITTLDLSRSGIGDAGVQALVAESSNLKHLTLLDLRESNISAAGAQALAQSSNLRCLASLDLGLNRMGPRGYAALAASPYFQPNMIISVGRWQGTFADFQQRVFQRGQGGSSGRDR